MEVVATYFDADSLKLVEGAFRKLGIPYTLQNSATEVDVTEVFVAPEYYEKACTVVERLDEFLEEKTPGKQKNARICPTCSCEMEPRSDFNIEDSVTGIAFIFQCSKCGYIHTE